MPVMIRSFMLFAALVFAATAPAQPRQGPPPPQQDDDSEIVVTGTADRDRQVRDFVGALGHAPVRGQLSRFEWQVCPVVLGLSDAQNQAVVRRMRSVAEAADVPLGGSDCLPNVLVMVTRDKRAFLAELARDHRYLFDSLSRDQVRRIVRERGPATAWQVNGPLLDADGVEIPSGRISDNSPLVLFNRTSRTPSRLTASARQHFGAAVLVVELGALEGLTATQLADYAAMRTFARTDPARLPEAAPPTILNILDAPMGTPVPITLTRWDFGYLRGLSTSDDTFYASSRRSQIRRTLEEELEAEEADGN